MSAPDPLGDRLVAWMTLNRDGLDALMAQEGSRAVHEEFIEAEGGTLPDRETRIARARSAGARAWMRHLAHALGAEWNGDPALPDRVTAWMEANRERLEALVLEEQAAAERRGASGDPAADRRDVELAAHARMLAEAVATVAGPLGDDASAPAFGRRVASWSRAHDRERREREREARATAPGDERVAEAAGVWAHACVTAEALGAALTPPEAPA